MSEYTEKLKELLLLATKVGASDVHLKTYVAPVLRINGNLTKIDEFGVLKPEMLNPMIGSILNDEQRKSFK
ncbi:MAG TPA: type IV pili twitching motility protein PilT, partial [bacterium]|nr:type IV pili twitching motility protein PilT [bacterium]